MGWSSSAGQRRLPQHVRAAAPVRSKVRSSAANSQTGKSPLAFAIQAQAADCAPAPECRRRRGSARRRVGVVGVQVQQDDRDAASAVPSSTGADQARLERGRNSIASAAASRRRRSARACVARRGTGADRRAVRPRSRALRGSEASSWTPSRPAALQLGLVGRRASRRLAISRAASMATRCRSRVRGSGGFLEVPWPIPGGDRPRPAGAQKMSNEASSAWPFVFLDVAGGQDAVVVLLLHVVLEGAGRAFRQQVAAAVGDRDRDDARRRRLVGDRHVLAGRRACSRSRSAGRPCRRIRRGPATGSCRADPDGGHQVAAEAREPGVAVVVGRAGLAADVLAFEHLGGGCRAALDHVAHQRLVRKAVRSSIARGASASGAGGPTKARVVDRRRRLRRRASAPPALEVEAVDHGRRRAASPARRSRAAAAGARMASRATIDAVAVDDARR